MTTQSLKIRPGVMGDLTPTLNEAGISAANLIRFREGLPEKLGGWQKFYPGNIGSIPRALHAWADLNGTPRLAVGATGSLSVLLSGGVTDITPQQLLTNPNPNFNTTSGSPTVTITDTNVSNITALDSIYFNTVVTVGGLILSGEYQIQTIVNTNTYTITAASNATTTSGTARIQNISQANPAVVTAPGHTFTNGQFVTINNVLGMFQVNGNIYTVLALWPGLPSSFPGLTVQTLLLTSLAATLTLALFLSFRRLLTRRLSR
jgi:hypothetical protein